MWDVWKKNRGHLTHPAERAWQKQVPSTRLEDLQVEDAVGLNSHRHVCILRWCTWNHEVHPDMCLRSQSKEFLMQRQAWSIALDKSSCSKAKQGVIPNHCLSEIVPYWADKDRKSGA